MTSKIEAVFYDDEGTIHGMPKWIIDAFNRKFFGEKLISIGEQLVFFGKTTDAITPIHRDNWIVYDHGFIYEMSSEKFDSQYTQIQLEFGETASIKDETLKINQPMIQYFTFENEG